MAHGGSSSLRISTAETRTKPSIVAISPQVIDQIAPIAGRAAIIFQKTRVFTSQGPNYRFTIRVTAFDSAHSEIATWETPAQPARPLTQAAAIAV
jgi:hypothetical protein